MKGITLWFTGLPCCGKTTLAKRVRDKMMDDGLQVELLDGDTIRDFLNNQDFSKEGRLRHLDYIIYIAESLNKHGVSAICSFVSPYELTRERARTKITNYFEIYVKCSVEECIKRDVKGMYKKALDGEIKGFTGIDAPYEEPKNPHLVVDSENKTIDECMEEILHGEWKS